MELHAYFHSVYSVNDSAAPTGHIFSSIYRQQPHEHNVRATSSTSTYRQHDYHLRDDAFAVNRQRAPANAYVPGVSDQEEVPSKRDRTRNNRAEVLGNWNEHQLHFERSVSNTRNNPFIAEAATAEYGQNRLTSITQQRFQSDFNEDQIESRRSFNNFGGPFRAVDKENVVAVRQQVIERIAQYVFHGDVNNENQRNEISSSHKQIPNTKLRFDYSDTFRFANEFPAQTVVTSKRNGRGGMTTTFQEYNANVKW